MTDLPPLSDDDLSLALDGEADAELLARIHADPEAQTRLDELRAAQALLTGSSIPPLGDDVVDGLVATAIDTPVAPVRTGRTGQRRAAPWIVAAAVILLMAVGLSLVWAGRSDDQDQAGASLTAQDAAAEKTEGTAADSSFSDSAAGGSSATDEGPSGGHGSPTTVASPTASADAVPVLYLGSYSSGADLRTATATSLDDAWQKSGARLQYGDTTTEADDEAAGRRGLSAQNPPSQSSVDRCAEQLQVTLSMEKAPIQTGYATVAGKDVLVYEFATTSAKDAGRETTLVAAVGADACDEVVFFER
ncbi:MAG: hypothetical protein ACTHN0_04150 [Aquihabitans sp.]